uniref:Uncharacterized protein n=1 Tax=Pseudomonas phage Cygsa01 TaxID=3138529 RepID=A0AAU6W3G2_9VIRU
MNIGPGRIVGMKGFSDASPNMTVKYGAHKDHYTMFLLLGSAHKEKFADFNPYDALNRLGFVQDKTLSPRDAAELIGTIGQDGTSGQIEIPDGGMTIGINATLNLPQLEALVAKMRDLQGDEAKGAFDTLYPSEAANGDS